MFLNENCNKKITGNLTANFEGMYYVFFREMYKNYINFQRLTNYVY